RVDITVSGRRPVAELIAAATAALRSNHPLPTVAGSAPPGSCVLVGSPLLVDAALCNPRGRRFDAFRADAPGYTLAFAGGGVGRAGRLVNPWRYGSGAELSA